MRKLAIAAVSLAAVTMSTAAFSQQSTTSNPPTQDAAPPAQSAPAVNPKAGDKVYDPAGQVVGVIKGVKDPNAVLSTGKDKVTVPLTAFSGSPKGLTINMSKADLDAAIQSAKKGGAKS